MERNLRRAAAGALLAVALLACGLIVFWPWPEGPGPEPFFSGLGSYHRAVSTKSPTAQRYFDQGMVFLIGFNPVEALHSFEAATQQDPECAMAYWGMAMANGPYLNDMLVDFRHGKAGWNAVKKAKEHSGNASPVERALIDALAQRFPYPPPTDRKPVDRQYAEAMRAVHARFPDDADVAALTAEAMIELRPWDQWKSDGKPQPGTEELLRTLQSALARSPQHLLASHILIHAVEGSPHPEQADRAADLLRDLTPGVEHLLHMPSHIDVHRGRWREAIVANEKAIAAEQAYRKVAPPREFYGFGILHDSHMLLYAAMMSGQSRKAMAGMHDVIASIPAEAIKDKPETFDDVFSMPFEVLLRFGKWDEIIAHPAPRFELPVARTFWHYARAIAFAVKGKQAEAESEREAFLGERKAIPANRTYFRTTAKTVVELAAAMLDGELNYRLKKTGPALAALRRAVQIEDGLPFADPPIWLVPARHALGAALLDAGQLAEAEQVYRADLARNPENGWSLYGLSRCLQLQDKKAEAAAVEERFHRAWQDADVALTASCFCLSPGSHEQH